MKLLKINERLSSLIKAKHNNNSPRTSTQNILQPTIVGEEWNEEIKNDEKKNQNFETNSENINQSIELINDDKLIDELKPTIEKVKQQEIDELDKNQTNKENNENEHSDLESSIIHKVEKSEETNYFYIQQSRKKILHYYFEKMFRLGKIVSSPQKLSEKELPHLSSRKILNPWKNLLFLWKIF